MGSADHAVGCTVVERDAVANDQVTVGKDDLAEEALLLVGSQRPHDGRLGACQHPPGLVEVEQQRAKTVTVLLGCAVINLQPPRGGFDRRRACANTSAVPVSIAAVGQTTVPAPVNKVR